MDCFPYARHHSNCFICVVILSSYHHYVVGPVTIPIQQMRKLRHREINLLKSIQFVWDIN